jgi:hypothetical protein
LRYIGIDPGQSGGLVLLNCKGFPLEWAGMPEDEAGLWQLLQRWSSEAGADGVRAFLEKVRSSPQMSKGSIFVFGWGYGGLRMALIAAGIPFDEVAPQKWQKFVGVRDKTGARALKDVNTTEKKNRHKAKAQEVFPMLSITHKIADASLIALYGQRMSEGFGAELPKS